MVPDPNHNWPPYEGDKLIGRFTLGNNGGSALRITGYGVRMRRNSTDYWDFLNTNAFDLQPNQTVRFDQNNERTLASGHYRAEITWQINGGSWQVSNGTEFDVIARPGSIYVSSGLELLPDPNHTWPPYAGDKLIGRFGLGNNGGSAVHVSGYGVRMRRNSTDYWDFLNTNAFDLQPGQTASFNQNNERALEAGHYRAEITWQVNGGSWQVSNSIEFDVTTRPGSIYVSSGLELITDPNHAWPPYAGDKLVGRFSLGNNGGSAVRITGYGVRMRRNSTDYWDFLNTNAFDLQAGQTVNFNQNNERTLEVGHYRAEITWQVNGGSWQIADAIEFDVQTQPITSQIVLVENLTLQSNPSGNWPPLVSDQLTAHIHIRNNGQQTIHLNHIGVRGRRNGSENWDIGWWAIDLAPGAEWSLDPRNERTLSDGSYSFRISYDYNGTWTEIGNEINFAINPPTTTLDAAQLVDKIGIISTSPGSNVRAWVELRNTGNTVWSDASQYYFTALGSTYGAQSPQSMGQDVWPGHTKRFEILFTAPSNSGNSTWQLRHNSSGFGPQIRFDFQISGTIPSAGDIYKLKLASPIYLNPVSPSLNQQVEASYLLHNPTGSAITIPYLGVSGRSPSGGPYDDDAPFRWLEYVTIPANSDYTVLVNQIFSEPGPYGFYPALRLQGDAIPLPIRFDGTGGEAWLDNTIWKYINITESQYAQLAQCRLGWGDTSAQVPWRDKASDMLGISCTKPIYHPENDTITFEEIQFENKLQTLIHIRFENLTGASDPSNALQATYYLFPSKPWPVLPWYSPSKLVLKNVTLSRNSMIKVIAWRNRDLSDLQGLDWIMWPLDIFSYLGLGSHIGNSDSDTQKNIADLALKIADLITKEQSVGPIIYDSFTSLSDPQNTSADPFGTVSKVVNAMDRLSKIQNAAPQVHYLYVKAGTPGAASTNFSGILSKAQGFFRNVKLIGLFGDIMTSPVRVELFISPTTNPNGIGLTSATMEQPVSFLSSASTLANYVSGNHVVGVSGERVPGNERFRLSDGSFDSGWAADYSDVNRPWVTLELANGAPVVMDQIRIYPGPTLNQPTASALRDYHIDYSLDNMNYWYLVSGTIDVSEVGSFHTINLPSPTLARYIRISVDSIQDNSAVQFVNMGEVEIGGHVGFLQDNYEGDGIVAGATLMVPGLSRQTHNFGYPGDVDWVKFGAQAGKKYTIKTSNLAANADTVIYLYDQDGISTITWNDDGGSGLASRIDWIAPSSGTYYVQIFNYRWQRYGPGTNYDFEISNSSNQIFLPAVINGQTIQTGTPKPTINGFVTNHGGPIEGIFLALRFYDGSSYSTRMITTTRADGFYQFDNVPPLNTGEFYYVKYSNNGFGNTENSEFLWFWNSFVIPNTSASLINGGIFDIANFEMLSPNHGSTVSLPVTFQWQTRPAALLDDYEVDLADPENANVYWWTDPTLGYVGSYVMNTFPPNFVTNKFYSWVMWVYDGYGGYGTSHWSYWISFSSGLSPNSSNITPNRTHSYPNFLNPDKTDPDPSKTGNSNNIKK